MSWDISIIKFSQAYTTVEAIPDDEKPLDIGVLPRVHAAVSQHFPGTDWNDPLWGIFDSPFGSIEFNVGSDNPVKSMMLHVRASKRILAPIIALCCSQEWSALDCSTGGFLEHADDPAAGIEGWRAFRDRVISQKESGT